MTAVYCGLPIRNIEKSKHPSPSAATSTRRRNWCLEFQVCRFRGGGSPPSGEGQDEETANVVREAGTPLRGLESSTRQHSMFAGLSWGSRSSGKSSGGRQEGV